jgi:hypothetical protein
VRLGPQVGARDVVAETDRRQCDEAEVAADQVGPLLLEHSEQDGAEVDVGDNQQQTDVYRHVHVAVVVRTQSATKARRELHLRMTIKLNDSVPSATLVNAPDTGYILTAAEATRLPFDDNQTRCKSVWIDQFMYMQSSVISLN